MSQKSKSQTEELNMYNILVLYTLPERVARQGGEVQDNSCNINIVINVHILIYGIRVLYPAMYRSFVSFAECGEEPSRSKGSFVKRKCCFCFVVIIHV